jgi:DNA-binding NtrC family response regulator
LHDGIPVVFPMKCVSKATGAEVFQESPPVARVEKMMTSKSLECWIYLAACRRQYRLVVEKPVVIVADDEEAIRLIVTHVIRNLGCEVLPARDGQEALDIANARSGAVTLLVSDVDMPRLRGTDLCERVAREWPGTALILMTGNGWRLGEGCAALPLLLKPFTVGQLTALVREALTEHQRAPAEDRVATVKTA